MRVPKSQPEACKVKILGRLWTLVKKHPPHPLYDGLCCYDNRQIMFAPAGLRTRRLELLAHELLHARFRELDEESILEAGRLIDRIHKKVRNYGFRIKNTQPVQMTAVKPAKSARIRSSHKKKPVKKTGSGVKKKSLK